MQSSLALAHGARTCFPRTSVKSFSSKEIPKPRNLTEPFHFSNCYLSISTFKLANFQETLQLTKPISIIPCRRERLHPYANSSDNVDTSDNGGSVTSTSKSGIEVVGEAISTAFPLWVALGCLLGLLRPTAYDWVKPSWTMMGITLTMLGMGMTLTFDDLRGALSMPKELCAGFVLQYSVCFSLSDSFILFLSFIRYNSFLCELGLFCEISSFCFLHYFKIQSTNLNCFGVFNH